MMKTLKVLCVVGARPNFMKVAPLIEELGRRGIGHYLVHTGQHYDARMSQFFFEDLGLPRPDIDLGVGSGSHGRQTAEVLLRIEPVLERERPSLVVVVGDVNSTLAAALAAVKLGIPVAHVEAGLRSFDRAMPEEINRVMTDAVADLHFTTEADAGEHLRREGVAPEKIHFVGNTMIDSLLKHVRRSDDSSVLEDFGVLPKGYAVLTLHRPSNVDDRDNLGAILEAVRAVSAELPVVFPIHPRTRNKVAEFGLEELLRAPGVVLSEPLGYLDFLKLNKDSRLVLTDSGGIQEETTVLGIPCLTLRNNTERPATVRFGANVLVGADRDRIIAEARARISRPGAGAGVPPLWDGRAAQRIVDIVVEKFGSAGYGDRAGRQSLSASA